MNLIRQLVLWFLVVNGVALFGGRTVGQDDRVPPGEAKPEITRQWRELTDRGKYREALELADRTVTGHPKLATPIFLRGLSHGNLGEWERAIDDFSEAVKLGYAPAEGYAHRGWAEAQLGRSKAAIASYTLAFAA